jgi:hypothetical protein
MKIYIAGPMTGLPNFNRDAFFQAESNLTLRGHYVLNPATLPNGLSQHEYMDICQAMVRSADAIFMLSGWEASRGALAELYQARKLGLLIIYQKLPRSRTSNTPAKLRADTLYDPNAGWLQRFPDNGDLS